MLARRSHLRLPDGSNCELPLLVPSFSSKGFGVYPSRPHKSRAQVSVISADLFEFGQAPATSLLVSGFDLHFKHFGLPRTTKKNCLDWITNARVVFLDSGGYELAPDFDSSEPKSPPYQARSGFDRAEYMSVLEGLRKRALKQNLVVSNFDWGTRGKALVAQISDARAIQRQHPKVLHNFILKPWTSGATIIDPKRLTPKEFQDLAGFDIIGVTEKELGADLLDRLKRVALLRAGLDRSGIAAPIHVWGGLDPMLTPLYFFAGAEIFDGVSWLRYAFIDGLAVNRECAATLDHELGVEARRGLSHPMISFRNRSYLERLTGCLQQWVDFEGVNFSMFPRSTREHLARAYRTMVTKIPELGGTQRGR